MLITEMLLVPTYFHVMKTPFLQRYFVSSHTLYLSYRDSAILVGKVWEEECNQLSTRSVHNFLKTENGKNAAERLLRIYIFGLPTICRVALA